MVMDKMNTLQLLSGNILDYEHPELLVCEPDDMIIPLCNNCRWAGQLALGRWYSIAQHAWNTSQLVSREFALEALWHDRSEAFTNDIVTPLKRMFPAVKALEIQLEYRTADILGLPREMSPEVKVADMQMLGLEVKYLRGEDPAGYRALADVEFEHLLPLVDLTPWTPRQAYYNFHQRLKELS